MILKHVSPPVIVEPAGIEAAATEARVSTASDKARLETYLVPARVDVERWLGRAIPTQTWDLSLPTFPYGKRSIELPYPPLQSVTSVTYVAGDGTTATLATSQYAVLVPTSEDAPAGAIELKYDCDWPSIRGGTSAEVTIRFVAGYATVPTSLKLAIARRAAELFDGREMDEVTKRLLAPFTVWAA